MPKTLILALAPLIALQLILMIAALVDVSRRQYVRGGSKLPWVLLVILFGTIGPIAYFALGRTEPDEGD